MTSRSDFEQNILKAEEWARLLKEALPTLKNRKYVERHIKLLEWLIEQAKKAGANG